MPQLRAQITYRINQFGNHAKSYIMALLHFGISPNASSTQNQKIYIYNAGVGISLLFVIISFTVNALTTQSHVIVIDASAILLLVLILALNRLRHIAVSKFLFFVVFIILNAFYNYFVPNTGAENVLFTVIFFAVLVINRKRVIAAITMLYICLYILCKINSIQYFWVSPDANYSYIDNYTVFIYSILCGIGIAFVYNSNLTKLIFTIEAKNVELQEQNQLVHTLMHELNHRVKNNLQLMSSLFNIQANKARAPEIRDALNDAKNRIASIAILHTKLYSNGEVHEVGIYEYLRELCNFLVQYAGQMDHIKINLQIEELRCNIREAVHVGLIVNELVTNTLKYGLSDAPNCISIWMSSKGCGHYQLIYSDTGSGFPEGFDPNRTKSFGYDLMKTIVEQYDGSLRAYNNGGARVEIQLLLQPNN